MNKIKTIFAIAFATLTLNAADVALEWDKNDPSDNVSNYIVYQAVTITGPFLPVARPTENKVTLAVTPGVYFWYVTAVSQSFWGALESGPSNIVNTPAAGTKPKDTSGLIIHLVK